MTTKLRALDGERIEIFSDGNTYNGYLQMDGNNIKISGLNIALASAGNIMASIDSTGQVWKGSVVGAGFKYWNEDNDGAGSGLDADKLDGYDAAITSTASAVVVRDANQNIFINKINAISLTAANGVFGHATQNSDYPIWRPAENTPTTGIFYNTGTDSLIEFSTAGAVKASISITNGDIAGNVLKSSVATGTAPLTVASSTVVTNLNADKLDGNDAAAFATAGHIHANLVAGNGILGTTYTGANTYTWSVSSHTGTTGSVGTLVIGSDTVGVSLGTTGVTACAGNDTRLSNDRTPLAHGDDKHNHQKFIRISYSGLNKGYRWNHGLNSANVIFTIISNTAESHYFYKIVDNNNVDIYLDDEPYGELTLDATATKVTTLSAAAANIIS